MIWRLMKREPVLPYGLLFLWPFLAFGLLSGAPAQWYSMLALWPLFGGEPWRRATRFEAALPIPARQFFLARLLTLMALTWPQAFALSVALALWPGPAYAALTPLAAAGVCTLAIAVLQSVRLAEIASIRRRCGVLVCICLFAGVFSGAHIGSRTAGAILSISLFASAALLFRTWRFLPKAFVFAAPAGPSARFVIGTVILPEPDAPAPPARAPESREAAGAFARTFAPWMPFLRTLYPPRQVIWLPMLCFVTAVPQMIPMCGFWLLFMWQEPAQRAGWMRTLPIDRRRVLWAILAPLPVYLCAGYAIGAALRTARRPLQLQAVTLAVILAIAFSTFLFCAAPEWRRLRRIPLCIRGWLPAVPPVLSLAAMVLPTILHRPPRIVNPLRTLASALPASPFQAVALLALPVVALYLALDKVFCESDHTGKLGVWNQGWWPE